MQRVFFSMLDQVVGELKARFSGKKQGVVSAVSALLPRSTSFLDETLLQPLAELARVDSEFTQGEIAVAKPFLLKTLVSDCNLHEALVIISRFQEASPCWQRCIRLPSQLVFRRQLVRIPSQH